MKTTEFITLYEPCSDGQEFAEKYETMSEVWVACERPAWLFWILEKHKPLEKEQSVRLAIAFAESSLGNLKLDDDRPALAIQSAKDWLENSCDETVYAARSAAESARSAARYAAWYAARSVAESAWYAARSAAESAWYAARYGAESAWYAARSVAESAWYAARSAAESARSGAESAAESARSGAESAARYAAWSAQANEIRSLIKNPFI